MADNDTPPGTANTSTEVDIPNSEDDVEHLAELVVRGSLPAEDYFAAIDRRATRLVDAHSRDAGVLKRFLRNRT